VSARTLITKKAVVGIWFSINFAHADPLNFSGHTIATRMKTSSAPNLLRRYVRVKILRAMMQRRKE
jgi:hypothetical protein